MDIVSFAWYDKNTDREHYLYIEGTFSKGDPGDPPDSDEFDIANIYLYYNYDFTGSNKKVTKIFENMARNGNDVWGDLQQLCLDNYEESEPDYDLMRKSREEQ